MSTTNVSNGTTLFWNIQAISGNVNASDFSSGGITNGSFVINNNSGNITLSITSDSTTEGSESFALQILTGSATGTVVATSSTITINDTSTTPIPAPTISLSASPSSVTTNNPEAVSSSTLTWSSTNATSVISSNFGAGSVNGSAIVSPSSTTNYSITVSGAGGTANASTTVTCTACIVPSGTSTYGVGFNGYLKYGNGERIAASNGSSLFITRANDTYFNFPSAITTAGGVVTTYAEVGNQIVTHYTFALGRYPESIGFDGWFYDFLNFPGYTSFQVLVNTITTAFNQPGGEASIRASKGGLIGNYDTCNNRRA